MRNDDPISLEDSLSEVLRILHPEPKRVTTGTSPTGSVGSAGSSMAALGGVFGRWEQAVGAQVAAHVQPVKLDGTLLVVSVDDPAWATQLRFLEATLRERLLEVAGAQIERIEVRVARTGGGGRSRRTDPTSPTL